jgi:glycosyltransferase involved in cell wall biosynthesis
VAKNKAKLVINMIVHNDAIYLPVVVPALQLFADRIIFVDQGSTDSSVELIQATLRPHDYVHYNHENILDLSVSRNKMLEYCNDGDWILKWDSDELPSDQMIESLNRFISKHDEVGWSVPCYHIMKEPRQCLPIEYGFGHLCLFKKTLQVRWLEPIHTYVAGIAANISSIPLESGISIIHFSYYAEKRFKKKAMLYAQIPGSGFTSPQDLIRRLELQPLSLPPFVTYTAAPEWLEKLRNAP